MLPRGRDRGCQLDRLLFSATAVTAVVVACVQLSEDDIEIDVDRIDAATFWVVDRMLTSYLGIEKKRPAVATAVASGGGSSSGAGTPAAKKLKQ